MRKRYATNPILLESKQSIPPDRLLLDDENPRLTGLDVGLDAQDKIIRYLWDTKDVAELVDSISNSGYWPQELLFAITKNDRLVVVEGNRRLAAVQLLLSPERCARLNIKGVPSSLSANVKKTLETLPVIVCTREDLWKYMSFKHLNGPQEWDSIAKAKYIARVHDDFKVPLDVIADTIGDRHETVKRLFYGLRVLEQARKAGVFTEQDRWPSRRFPYSHLWTALGYSSVRRFLRLKTDNMGKTDPVPKSRVQDLGLFCTWLYGNKEQKRKPLVVTQNPDLRNLAEVMGTENGIAALRRELPLDVCIRQSRGDSEMLREALVEVESGLREVSAYVGTGYSGEKDVLQLAEKIADISSDVVERMKVRRGKEAKS